MNPEIKELQKRWIGMLRMKARDYEHSARRKGEVVVGPSLDEICNEIDAFFTGLNFKI